MHFKVISETGQLRHGKDYDGPSPAKMGWWVHGDLQQFASNTVWSATFAETALAYRGLGCMKPLDHGFCFLSTPLINLHQDSAPTDILL